MAASGPTQGQVLGLCQPVSIVTTHSAWTLSKMHLGFADGQKLAQCTFPHKQHIFLKCNSTTSWPLLASGIKVEMWERRGKNIKGKQFPQLLVNSPNKLKHCHVSWAFYLHQQWGHLNRVRALYLPCTLERFKDKQANKNTGLLGPCVCPCSVLF